MADETSKEAPVGKRNRDATEVRMIYKCQHGNANDVVTLSGAQLADAIEGGHADATPEAVAYAKALAASQVKPKAAE